MTELRPPPRTHIAILGVGPWGLCAFERLVAHLRAQPAALRRSTLHLVDPRPFGTGIYEPDQPDFLVMNNMCGDIQLAQGAPGPASGYALSLFDWAQREGFRWSGHRCRRSDTGVAVTPRDFLPRSIMGEYLNWFFETVRSSAPPEVEVVTYLMAAVALRPASNGRETVVLQSGETVTCDYVIVTIGHPPNRATKTDAITPQSPYPVGARIGSLAAGESIAIAGMGLVAMDTVAACTLGRGGSFEPDGPRLRYVPSGNEPNIFIYSRSGLPFRAKPENLDPFPLYTTAIFATPSALRHRIEDVGPAWRFQRDLLPVFLREMQARYYLQHVSLSRGLQEADALREVLSCADTEVAMQDALRPYEQDYGMFDPAALFWGPPLQFRDGADYTRFIRAELTANLDDIARFNNASPTVAAAETFRHLRDTLRDIVERDMPDPSAYADFNAIKTQVARLISGPPFWRLEQLIALQTAGLLHFSSGPAPTVTAAEDGLQLTSTRLDQEWTGSVTRVFKGYSDDARVRFSACPMITQMVADGRLRERYCGSDQAVGVDLSEEAQPINRRGIAEPAILMFGTLSEGARYFTHYIASPVRGKRGFEEIDRGTRSIVARLVARLRAFAHPTKVET
jgi:hypothetical protein